MPNSTASSINNSVTKRTACLTVPPPSREDEVALAIANGVGVSVGVPGAVGVEWFSTVGLKINDAGVRVPTGAAANLFLALVAEAIGIEVVDFALGVALAEWVDTVVGVALAEWVDTVVGVMVGGLI